jgi:rhodanese-related sulfurtransferase
MGAVGLVIVGLVVLQQVSTAPVGGGERATASEPIGTFDSVSPERFAALAAAQEVTIIDIRTPEEIAAGKVTPDALELDYYAADFDERLASLDRDARYAIYCRSGNRTGATLERMRALGFTNVVDLAGGKQAWERSGRPLVAGSACTGGTC